MIALLSKLFIKDRENISSPGVRQAYGMLSGIVGIFLNILLFAGKLFAGTISGSIAITADAFNNLSDAGSSIITLVGFKLAGQKADTDHPFGHGRMEYIAGFIVSVAIILMGFELGKSSFTKILHPQDAQWSLLSLVILLVSVLVKIYMALYNRKLAKKIESPTLMATSKDSLSDTISTSIVIISMLVARFTDINIDAYCGLVVAALILYGGYGAAKDTISPLLGQPPTKEFVNKIENIVMSHSTIVGIHDLVVHDYGPGRLMISLHAEVPSDGDIMVMHDLVDNIEHDLQDELGCEAVIHMDPIAVDDELTSQTRKKVTELVKSIDEQISIHDFRMVVGPTHTNLIFDAVVPYTLKLSDSAATEQIKHLVSEMDGNYFAVVKIDKAYVK